MTHTIYYIYYIETTTKKGHIMREQLYKIFVLGRSEKLATFCFTLFMIGCFLVVLSGNKPIKDYHDLLIFLIPTIPTLFFTIWFILALIVLGIEKLIIAPIEFVVYKLGIPKIKINVDVIWKYQQKKS